MKKFFIKKLTLCFLAAALLLLKKVDVKAANSAIHFIDCGNGNATLIETTINGKKAFGLIDAGSGEEVKLENGQTREPVKYYLGQHLGTTKLSFIMITHLDLDHVGGIPTVMDNYADSNTVLYFKDTSTSLKNYVKIATGNSKTANDNRLARYNNIRKKAKEKGMSVTKIIPYAALPSGLSVSNLNTNLTTNMMKTKLKPYKYENGKYQYTGSTSSNFVFGEYTITFFNGQDWKTSGLIKGYNENVNSVTTLLRCVTSNKKVYTTYLGSDLATDYDYNKIISLKTVQALNCKVSLYQMAHHGNRDSITTEIAKKLNFSKVIVTTSYQTLCGKKKDTDKDTEAINALINMIGEVKDDKCEGSYKYWVSGTVYFTGGTKFKDDKDSFIFDDESNSKIKAIFDRANLAETGDRFQNGTVVAEMGDKLNITQNSR